MTVDASLLEVTLTGDYDLKPGGSVPGRVNGSADWVVHGNVSVVQDVDGNISISSEPYDFDLKKQGEYHGNELERYGRNAATILGGTVARDGMESSGTGFRIKFEGQPKIVERKK